MGCATGTIAAYVPTSEMPWNRMRVAHLYRRLAFGATNQQIIDGLAMSPDALIDQIIDQTLALPLSPAPIWADWTRYPIDDYAAGGDFSDQAYGHLFELVPQWLNDMLTNSFRGKLALFWHNHFVTRFDTYDCSAYLYEYYKLLQEYALGNFRIFAHKMGITPAMLMYLNGNENEVESPNENYARELMELFTMGRDNGYTEDDIVEMSRALTGWRASWETCEPANFVAERFDNENKTIFGQTGNWRNDPDPEHPDNVVNLIIAHRGDETATYICGKLYRFFVANEIDENIVAEMATTFKNNNFEIAPVLRQLFKSEHFFDEANIGHNIKSPMEWYLSKIHTLEIPYTDETLSSVFWFSFELGQYLFFPVNVAGWPGHRAWINENALTRRWETTPYFSLWLELPILQSWVTLVKNLSGNSNNPLTITTAVADFMFPKGLPLEQDYINATDVLKGDIPQNYFDDGSWNLDWEEAPYQLRDLVYYLMRLPSYQLN